MRKSNVINSLGAKIKNIWKHHHHLVYLEDTGSSEEEDAIENCSKFCMYNVCDQCIFNVLFDDYTPKV